MNKTSEQRTVEMHQNPGQFFIDMEISATVMDCADRRGTAALIRLASLQITDTVIDESDLKNLCLKLLEPIIKRAARESSNAKTAQP